MPVPIIDVKDLNVSFSTRRGEVHAVRNVSFQLERGRILGVVGESGSGKSVTIRAILNMLPDAMSTSSGNVGFDGENLLSLSERRMYAIRGRRISTILQDPQSALNPVRRIGDQVVESMTLHGRGRAESRERAIMLLERVGIDEPEKALRRYPHEFSGGMRQRVVIAMAVANDPDVILADEPTTALDVTTQLQVLELIESLRDEMGVAILLVTHDMGVVRRICDDVVVMRNGQIVERGATAQVLSNPAATYTQTLIDATPNMTDPLREAPSVPGGPVLAVEGLVTDVNLGKRGAFRRKKPNIIVDQVSLSLYKGETLALVGESGSGKSTLSRTMIGLYPLAGGNLSIDGRLVDMRSDAAMRALLNRVQYVFQDPLAALDPRMTVRESMLEALRLAQVPRNECADRIKELFSIVRLEEGHLDRYPRYFSGGQRQRIGIARSLARRPDVLILDEPVSALDVSVQESVLNLLMDIQQETEVAYLFITHDLSVVRRIAHRVAVMRQGRIVESGPVDTVFRSPSNPYTQDLLKASLEA